MTLLGLATLQLNFSGACKMRFVEDLVSNEVEMIAEIERLRRALEHVVNCFPDMPAVALQTAQRALAGEPM